MKDYQIFARYVGEGRWRASTRLRLADGSAQIVGVYGVNETDARQRIAARIEKHLAEVAS